MEERFGSFQHASARDNWLYRASMPDSTPLVPLRPCRRNCLMLLHFFP